ncbi:hypothetical protein [Bradyrhizobium lupini]|uniref:hypothetical protein n=1 Tax=Rhizobium lupini TaxID=136996 RepID=UPI0034C5B462
MWKDRFSRITHCSAFQTSHGIAHIAYFVVVCAEGHGLYSAIGGVMVIFSMIHVAAGEW